MDATRGYVFISYSHGADGDYVAELDRFLTGEGIAVWFDEDIASGDRWESLIAERIEGCAAFVPVMSPAAEASKWVQREVHYADDLDRPILPLLRAGEVFFGLGDLQFCDVRDGRMPQEEFLAGLRRALAAPAPTPSPGAPVDPRPGPAIVSPRPAPEPGRAIGTDSGTAPRGRRRVRRPAVPAVAAATLVVLGTTSVLGAVHLLQ